MYKRAAKFTAYMDRTGRFIDRILAGGNRLDTDVIEAETEVNLLLDAYVRLLEIHAKYNEQCLKAKEERSAINRECQGKSDDKLPQHIAALRQSMNRRYREEFAKYQELDWKIELIRGRLTALGREVADRSAMPKIGLDRKKKSNREKIRPSKRTVERYKHVRWT